MGAPTGPGPSVWSPSGAGRSSGNPAHPGADNPCSTGYRTLMMMLRKMPALLFAGALALATGCDGDEEDTGGGGTGGEDRAATILGLEGDAASGETLFASSGCNIMSCHGADGLSGAAMPPLSSSVAAASDEQIVTTFLEGKGTMPAHSNLSDQQLADLLAYVTETFG